MVLEVIPKATDVKCTVLTILKHVISPAFYVLFLSQLILPSPITPIPNLSVTSLVSQLALS